MSVRILTALSCHLISIWAFVNRNNDNNNNNNVELIMHFYEQLKYKL
jgi:hypothetical protein